MTSERKSGSSYFGELLKERFVLIAEFLQERNDEDEEEESKNYLMFHFELTEFFFQLRTSLLKREGRAMKTRRVSFLLLRSVVLSNADVVDAELRPDEIVRRFVSLDRVGTTVDEIDWHHVPSKRSFVALSLSRRSSSRKYLLKNGSKFVDLCCLMRSNGTELTDLSEKMRNEAVERILLQFRSVENVLDDRSGREREEIIERRKTRVSLSVDSLRFPVQ